MLFEAMKMSVLIFFCNVTQSKIRSAVHINFFPSFPWATIIRGFECFVNRIYDFLILYNLVLLSVCIDYTHIEKFALCSQYTYIWTHRPEIYNQLSRYRNVFFELCFDVERTDRCHLVLVS